MKGYTKIVQRTFHLYTYISFSLIILQCDREISVLIQMKEKKEKKIIETNYRSKYRI